MPDVAAASQTGAREQMNTASGTANMPALELLMPAPRVTGLIR